MELLRSWILAVTASAMVIAGADALMPEGTVKRVGKLTGGLLLVLTLLQPLAGLDYQDLYDLVNTLPAGSVTQETLAETAADPLEGLIEGELAAYIAGKGAELGCPCTARVDCIPDEDGVPIPVEVVVAGSFTQKQKSDLQAYITQELGIGREYQQYISEESP